MRSSHKVTYESGKKLSFSPFLCFFQCIVGIQITSHFHYEVSLVPRLHHSLHCPFFGALTKVLYTDTMQNEMDFNHVRNVLQKSTETENVESGVDIEYYDKK